MQIYEKNTIVVVFLFLSDKEDGAYLGAVGGGKVDGAVDEFPNIVALFAWSTVFAATIPALLDVGGVIDEETLTVVDVEVGPDEATGDDDETVVAFLRGGEGVGCEDRSLEDGDDAEGSVEAHAVTNAEGYDDAVEVGGCIIVQMTALFCLVLPVDVPVAALEFVADVISV